MIIYKATSKTSGKSYIGQTRSSLRERRQGHYDNLKRYKNALGLAITKYGKDDFEWTIIQTCESIEELNKAEIKCIKEFNTVTPNGYNLTTGGEGGYIRSEENRLKISKSKLGKTPKNHSALFKKGHRLSPENEFKGTEVINLESGVVYKSIRDAAKAHTINHSTLAWRLRRKTTKQFAYVGAE